MSQKKLARSWASRSAPLRTVLENCQMIASSDDLGIDHQEPWLDVSVERFWDLSNIAFSHKVCNNRARRSAVGRKLTTAFNRNRSNAIGRNGMACKALQALRPF